MAMDSDGNYIPDNPDDWFATNAPPPPDASTASGAAANPQAANDAMNAQARQDPSYNPRDEIINRDQGSWQQQLQAYGGSLYNPTDLAGVDRQVSYAQNAGADPQTFIDQQKAIYDQRRNNVPGGHQEDVPRGGSGSGGNGYGSPSYIHPFTDQFSAPTMDQVRSTPGYQFQLDEGLKTINKGMAAKGTALTGGTAGYLSDRASDYADTKYGEAYGRAWDEYMGKFNIDRANQSDQYNSQRSNMLDQYGMMNTDRNFGLAANNQQFNQGLGVFGMNTTTSQNEFNNWLQYQNLTKPTDPSR